MPKKSAIRHVMGIVSSPRRGGNTDVLVDQVLRGAEQGGAEVTKTYLTRLDIRPCLACDGCIRTGRCVQQDDLAPLLEQMEQSHLWVVGTPVYFWGPTAQLKALVDRFYGARRHFSFEGRRAILVVPFEDTDSRTARHTTGMLYDAFDYLHIETLATILAPGVGPRGAVREDAALLASARNAGFEAVTNVQTAEKVGQSPPRRPVFPASNS